jgi:hypothetical protein
MLLDHSRTSTSLSRIALDAPEKVTAPSQSADRAAASTSSRNRALTRSYVSWSRARIMNRAAVLPGMMLGA